SASAVPNRSSAGRPIAANGFRSIVGQYCWSRPVTILNHIRRVISRGARAAQPSLRAVAAQVLRLGVCRSVLNGVDERVGHITLYRRRDFRVSDLVAFVYHTPRLQRPFLWRTHVGRSTFVVPVDPTFPDPRKAD